MLLIGVEFHHCKRFKSRVYIRDRRQMKSGKIDIRNAVNISVLSDRTSNILFNIEEEVFRWHY